ncbi:MAG: iron ABC transporter permease [Candidatus Omnitrophica bacterium]|nr:iron ABC transporter permease [Candidatus Omnitrophota bacterium]
MKIKYAAVFLILGLAILAGICFGTEFFSIPRLFSLSEIDKTILFRLRIPRLMAGFIVGAGLSVTGAVLQAILKNPLAESYTLGISGGASLGICIGVLLGRVTVIPYFAFLGAVMSIMIVLLASIKRRFSNPTVILLGVALNFLFSSFVLFVMAVIRNEQFQSTMLWLIGDISYFPGRLLAAGMVSITAISLFLVFSGRVYDIMSLGDEKAVSMGLNMEREKKLALLLCCVIVGFCVSLAGIIGFVGLIIPHITRFFFGPSHKRSLPVNFIAGGSFLVIADTAARTLIRPVEMPVGVITGFFGGLFFLAILLKGRYREMW